MESTILYPKNELTLQDRQFIADCLGLSQDGAIDSAWLTPYKKAVLSYCRSFKKDGLLLRANDAIKEKLSFFIDNYAINWLANEDELCRS